MAAGRCSLVARVPIAEIGLFRERQRRDLKEAQGNALGSAFEKTDEG
jgi:hypothetical protein